MNTWQRIKSVFTHRGAGRYLASSIGLLDGAGALGAKARPFDQRQAVRQFSSWVYAAAMLNAQAVAAVPLRLYVRSRIGRKLFATRRVPRPHVRYLAGERGDRVRPGRHVIAKAAEWGGDFEQVVEAHPALELLAKVNPHCNGFELATLRMLYLQITGDSYLHVVTGRALGAPIELWPMPSQWTRIIPSATRFVDGYTYGPDSATGVRFEPDEVIHWKLPNLDDLHYGRGRLQAVWSALGMHDAKRTMDLARFDNHARPDFLLVVKQGGSVEALDRFEKQIDQRLRGTRKAGRFITITGDVEAVPLNFPPDVLGDPDRVLEEIAAGFGVPISKLLANDPNRAAARTGDLAWLRDTILPYCRLDEEKLNEKYLPLFGIEDDAFLAYDNPVPDDNRFDLTRRERYVRSGIMTPNEVRAEEGLEPLPGGDTLRANAENNNV